MSEKVFKITVLGNPAAQKRHRTVTRAKGGRALPFARSYDPSASDKQDIRVIAQQQAPIELLTGPLCVDVIFYFPRPQSHYRTGKLVGELKDNAPLHHTKRPDRDNLDKLVLDALTGVFWKDDSQICEGEILKHYSKHPRTEITITVLNP